MLPTDESPAYDSPLEICILDGDVNGVMELIDAMDPSERSRNWLVVERLVGPRWRWLSQNTPNPLNARPGYGPHSANLLFRAIELARFMCSPDLPQADYWLHIGVQDIATFKQRYNPTPAARLTEKQLRGDHRWHYRNQVHRAVIAGLIERPQTDEYVQSLFFGDLRQHSNIVLQHVDADPGLAPYLLQLFDHEGSSDGSFAAVEKYCHDPELHWSHAFMALCARGVYTRTQLLDKTLGALACDWPQFKSGWFSRFHEILAPTVDEMAPFVPRYLALCHSRIAPTVSMAMDVIAPLVKAGHVDDDALCEALQPVITSAVKGRVLSALELLGQVVKRTPERAPAVSSIAVHALAHTGSDVQKKAIAYLQAWGLDADGQEAARNYAPFVSAVNQEALARLVGGVAALQTLAARQPSASVTDAPAMLSPLDANRALQTLTTIPDLVERIAYVLENPAEVDEWERVAEALVRLAPIPTLDRAAFLALKKRIKRLDWSTKPLGFAIARLMVCAVDGECTTTEVMPLQPDQAVNTQNFIAWRTHGLIAQAATGLGLPPLSAPTHRGGFIDPRQLEARMAAYQQAGASISAPEQTFANMRLPPANTNARTPITFDWQVTSSDPNDGGYVFHTLHVTSNSTPHPSGDHDYATLLCAKHATGLRWGNDHEAALIRFAASLQPADLEPFFAEAARAIGNNLDWWEAEWQNRAYLDVLLEPTTPMTPMARLTLALALAGKEPGQTALAVDALVQGVRDGRLDATALGETLARLWATPLVKGPRYAKSLAAAAQAHATMPRAVFALLCAMVEVRPDTPRKDMASLLELLLELKLTHQLAIPASIHMALGSMRLSGKSKLAAQEILG